MSNNSDTKTSLFFLTFPFFLSPLIFLFLFLPDRYRRTGSYSLGLSRPAHGGPETAPQPFRTCAERRLSEVVLLQLLFFPGVHSGISLFIFPPTRQGLRVRWVGQINITEAPRTSGVPERVLRHPMLGWNKSGTRSVAFRVAFRLLEELL